VIVNVAHLPLASVPRAQESAGLAAQCAEEDSKASDSNGDRTVTADAAAFPAFVTDTK
jgi:hypothetical protein